MEGNKIPSLLSINSLEMTKQGLCENLELCIVESLY